jgi:hypothetical protein
VNAGQLRYLVIRPTLEKLSLWSRAAEELLLGTAAQESQLGRYLKQHPTGPALGIYQMEPATARLVLAWVAKHRPALVPMLAELTAPASIIRGYAGDVGQLIWNLAYATAMARILYLSIPRPLPDVEDLQAQATYWKRSWNSPQGKGTPEQYVANYNRYVKGAT